MHDFSDFAGALTIDLRANEVICYPITINSSSLQRKKSNVKFRNRMVINMNKAYFQYIAALLMFGSNGIVASYILLNSYDKRQIS